MGVANLGVRPTVENVGQLQLEAFLFEFDGDLYGQRLNIELVERIRPEMRFSGIEQLQQQIARDVIAAKQDFR